jgi:hypothetical protein
MKKVPFSLLVLALVCASAAQAEPPGPPGGGVPPAEALATIPNLTTAQQLEVRRILTQRRDAQEAMQTKIRAEFEALHAKERNEHERIDDQASDQLRKALGEEGFRNYAEWNLAHRGPPSDGGRRPMPRGGRPGGPDNDGLPQSRPGKGKAAPGDEQDGE